MTPQAILDRYLQSNRRTAVDLAAKLKVDYAAIEAVLAGEECADPVALNRLGKGIGAPTEAWAKGLAAINIGVGGDDVDSFVHGRLWRLAITQGATLAKLAKTYKTSERVLQIALASGRVSENFLASGLPKALGYKEGEIQEAGVPQPVNARLGEMLKTAVAAKGVSLERLASDVGGIYTGSLKMLIDGLVPRKLQYFVVPALAKYLGLEVKVLAAQIALTWRATSTNAGTIKYEVVRFLYEHGQRPEWLAQRSGVKIDSIRHIFEGRLPARSYLEQLRAVLQVPESVWEEAINAQDAKRIAGSITYQSMSKAVKPLRILILEACDATKMDPKSWAQQWGIAHDTIFQIIERGGVPRRAEVRHLLMRALSVDRATLDSACRKTIEERESERDPQFEAPRNGLQEMLQRIMRQGVHPTDLAKRIRVSRRTILKIIKTGGLDMTMVVRERLRQYLRIDPDNFLALLDPIDNDAPLEDDLEMKLVANYRHLDEKQQDILFQLSQFMKAGGDFHAFTPKS